MKLNFLYTFLICLGLTTTIKAQEIIKPLKTGTPGEIGEGTVYYKDIDNTLDKYLETWLYDDGTTYFKVTFIKKEHAPISARDIGKDYRDKIACEYLLKINGVTKYDTYGVNSNIDDYMANYISGGLIVSENKLDILFYSEPPLNGGCQRYASGKLSLKYVPNLNNTELNWTRTNDELYGDSTECSDGTQMDTSEFLIPANMTLAKQ